MNKLKRPLDSESLRQTKRHITELDTGMAGLYIQNNSRKIDIPDEVRNKTSFIIEYRPGLDSFFDTFKKNEDFNVDMDIESDDVSEKGVSDSGEDSDIDDSPKFKPKIPDIFVRK